MITGRVQTVVLVIFLLTSGCGNNIRVTSNPSGAKVYSYEHHHQGWQYRGVTPLSYTCLTWQYKIAKVIWSDETESKVKRSPRDILGTKRNSFYFDKATDTVVTSGN